MASGGPGVLKNGGTPPPPRPKKKEEEEQQQKVFTKKTHGSDKWRNVANFHPESPRVWTSPSAPGAPNITGAMQDPPRPINNAGLVICLNDSKWKR
jgi:hypothetical protein